MQFRAEEYYQASLERMQQAIDLHRGGGSFALAIYCAGLAVEAMLRAFRWVEDTSFEGRHDLNDLLKASGLLKVDDEYMRRRGDDDEAIQTWSRQLRAAVNEVVALWHNNLRFASEKSLKAHLNRLDRLKGVKGDPLKKNSQDLIAAARMIVDRGVVLWTLKNE
jgi:HEPN domain-containing protein